MPDPRAMTASTTDSTVSAEAIARYVRPEFRQRIALPQGTPGSLTKVEEVHVVGHLTDLLNVAFMYIPSMAVGDALARPGIPPVAGRFLHATTFYADISGFTPLTAKLSAAGKAGAEEVTLLMNAFFGEMVDILHHHGGCLLKFGGDSLLALFPHEETPIPSGVPYDPRATWSVPRPDALRAAACALAMSEAMAKFRTVKTSCGPAQLEMSVGIAAGPVFAASVGIPGERMEYIVIGEPVYQSALAESYAASSEVVLTAYAASLLGPAAETTPAEAGHFRVDRCRVPPPAPPHVAEATAGLSAFKLEQRVRELVRRIEVLRPYLPAPLFGKLEANPENVQLEGENRFVTVVFTHLAGVGPLLQTWGPPRANDLTALLGDYFLLVHNTVSKYRGFLARIDSFTKGDKLLILFGTPVAQENDEESALLCSLEINEELISLNARRRTALLHRTGVNSGMAFCGNAGSLLRKEYTVMGDDVNVAARMMGRAPDHQVLVGAPTFARTQRRFRFSAPEDVKFKGKDAPIKVYTLLDARTDSTGAFQVGAPEDGSGGTTKTYGREPELEALDAAIARLSEGRGQLLVLSGEAGIGKSHLVRELVRRALKRGARVFGGQAQAHGQRTAYLPWLSVLKSFFGFAADEESTLRAAKIRQRIAELEPGLAEWAPLVAGILQVKMEEGPGLRTLDPKLRKERLFDTILALLRKAGRKTPILLAFEDASWLDDLSLELVKLVAQNVEDAPVLVAVSCRHERDLPSLNDIPGELRLRLGPLPEEAALTLSRELNGGAELPAAWNKPLLSRSNGNPLFLREILLALKQPGAPTGVSRVPDSLTGLLLARVDRLAETDRTVLRAASVLGPRFKFSSLSSLTPLPAGRDALAERMESLCKHDMLEREAPGVDPLYLFRQAMVQQVVYDTLPRSTRIVMHRRVATHFEKAEADKLDRYYELLCYHFEQGEEPLKLREYLIKAGDKALGAYANSQAIECFARASALFAVAEPVQLEPTEVAQIFSVFQSWAEVLRIVGQYPQGVSVLSRALAVAEGRQDKVAARELLLRLGELNFLRGDYPASLKNAEETLRRADGDPETLARAFNACGHIYRAVGDHENARKYVRKSYELLKRVGPKAKKKDLARTYQGLASVYLDEGLSDIAVKCLDRALDATRELGDRAELSRILLALGRAHLRRSDYEAALKAFQESLDIATGIGYREGIAANLDKMGQASLLVGQTVTAITYFKMALENLKKTGSQAGTGEVLNSMAEALTWTGEYPEALKSCDESLRIARQIGDAGLVARNLVRIGVIHSLQADYTTAQKNLTEAVGIVRKTGDKYQLAATLRMLGELYREMAEYKLALQFATEALALYREIGEKDGIASTLNDQALLMLALARHDDGERLLKDALAMADQLNARSLHGRLLDSSGRLNFLRNRYLESEVDFRQALDLRRKAKDKAGTADSLLNLGELLAARGDYPGALEANREGQQLYNELSHRRGQRTAVMRTGWIHILRGEYTEAMGNLEKAIAAARDIRDEVGLAEAMNLRGQLFRLMGQYGEAGSCHSKCLEIARRIGSPRLEIAALDHQGAVAAALGDFPGALKLHQEALDLAADVGDRKEGARILVNMSRVHTSLSNYDQAGPLLSQALGCAEEIQDEPAAVRALLFLGDVALLCGRPAEAVAQLGRAEERAKALGDRDTEIAVDIGLAQARMKMGEMALAAELLTKARASATEIVSRTRTLEATRLLGVRQRLCGEYGRSRESVDAALAGAAELGERGLEIEARADLAELAIELGALALARESLERAERLGRAAKAIGYLHRVTVLKGWSMLLEPEPNLPAASRVIEAALNVAATVGTAEWVIRGREALAHARALEGDVGTALDLVEQALGQATDRGLRALLPSLLGTAGHVYAVAGQYAESEAQYRRGLEEAGRMGATSMLWPLRAGLGDCLHAAGKEDAALAEYRHAAMVIRELAGTLPRAADRAIYLRSGAVAGVLELAKG
ncbi:MAG: tetratricopeptide repeat protein [Planctomycetes bacterium]|nr:tetratricopeptide repeat protein [Planctomycetota bacterium]